VVVQTNAAAVICRVLGNRITTTGISTVTTRVGSEWIDNIVTVAGSIVTLSGGATAHFRGNVVGTTTTSTITLTSGATPSVATDRPYFLTYASPGTITNFTGAGVGEYRVFTATNGNATIQNNANITVRGGADVTLASGNVIAFRLWGSAWREETRNF
jgi:hypothetical protein